MLCAATAGRRQPTTHRTGTTWCLRHDGSPQHSPPRITRRRDAQSIAAVDARATTAASIARRTAAAGPAIATSWRTRDRRQRAIDVERAGGETRLQDLADRAVLTGDDDEREELLLEDTDPRFDRFELRTHDEVERAPALPVGLLHRGALLSTVARPAAGTYGVVALLRTRQHESNLFPLPPEFDDVARRVPSGVIRISAVPLQQLLDRALALLNRHDGLARIARHASSSTSKS